MGIDDLKGQHKTSLNLLPEMDTVKTWQLCAVLNTGKQSVTHVFCQLTTLSWLITGP